MKNLISMTDYVLETANSKDLMETPLQKLNKHFTYANFLKQPLELWMFVPCDEDGNVLEEPEPTVMWTPRIQHYQQAKERCLFKNFEFVEETEHYFHLKEKGIYVFIIWKNKDKTIENVVTAGFELNKEIL